MEQGIEDLRQAIENRYGVHAYYLGSVGYQEPTGYKGWLEREAHFFRLINYSEWRYCVVHEKEEEPSRAPAFVLTNRVPGFAYSDFEDRLQALPGLAFESLVADLVGSSPRFTNVRREVLSRGLQIDLQAENVDEKRMTLFEVKRVRVGGADLVREMADRRDMLSGGQDQGFVLVIAGHLADAARGVAEERQLVVWDVEELVELLVAAPEVERRYFSEQPQTRRATGLWSWREEGGSAAERKARALVDCLGSLAPGDADCYKYQQLVHEIVEFLFVPPLGPIDYEASDSDGRNRRDLIVENWATDGFWAQVRDVYDARLLVIDAKNYTEPVGKGPVISTAHYLKPYGCGMFAMIFCRKGAGDAAMHARREQWIGGRKMVLVISDRDVEDMIRLKAKGAGPEERIRSMIADFVKSL